ncbi:hypothetical protein [Lentisalinibacter salinarum]|uniref:hypothetical protein n=1 Tax=Lentisalinibacter salinarum TaxID=2992239 RepID=UPI00386AF52D
MQVTDLQERLAALYQLEHGLAIEDFLVTDAATAGALTPPGARGRLDERLLLHHDGDEVSLTLYLDDALLARLRERNPLDDLDDDDLDDLWTAVEGISHFNYVVHNATARREVTLLELELQAEVDKFVSTVLLAREQGRRAVASRLHHLLFERMSLDRELGDEERERYRLANDYAGRFCRRIGARLHDAGEDVMCELRKFYRYSQRQKISHIHACAWS